MYTLKHRLLKCQFEKVVVVVGLNPDDIAYRPFLPCKMSLVTEKAICACAFCVVQISESLFNHIYPNLNLLHFKYKFLRKYPIIVHCNGVRGFVRVL
jgi:hypothetical protein